MPVDNYLRKGPLGRPVSNALWRMRSTGDFGSRPDGSQKGEGWLGYLRANGGPVSTELSVGVEIDGQETEIPLLVPSLSGDEVKWLLSTHGEGGIPEPILNKAVAHALERMRAGRSPFKD